MQVLCIKIKLEKPFILTSRFLSPSWLAGDGGNHILNYSKCMAIWSSLKHSMQLCSESANVQGFNFFFRSEKNTQEKYSNTYAGRRRIVVHLSLTFRREMY